MGAGGRFNRDKQGCHLPGWGDRSSPSAAAFPDKSHLGPVVALSPWRGTTGEPLSVPAALPAPFAPQSSLSRAFCWVAQGGGLSGVSPGPHEGLGSALVLGQRTNGSLRLPEGGSA